MLSTKTSRAIDLLKSRAMYNDRRPVTVNGYHIIWNTLYRTFQISHPKIGSVGEYTDPAAAVQDAMKGQ